MVIMSSVTDGKGVGKSYREYMQYIVLPPQVGLSQSVCSLSAWCLVIPCICI